MNSFRMIYQHALTSRVFGYANERILSSPAYL
jgi:hypothetical protein